MITWKFLLMMWIYSSDGSNFNLPVAQFDEKSPCIEAAQLLASHMLNNDYRFQCVIDAKWGRK